MGESFRHDYYQSDITVVLAVYVKNIQQDRVQVELSGNTLFINFEDRNGSLYERTFELAETVTEAKPDVMGTKMEIILTKSQPGLHWASLEKLDKESVSGEFAPKYPSSSRKPIDIDKLDEELKDDGPVDKEAQVDSFFKQLYKDADEDTRRAMMKSFMESGGTVLSTNWDEVKAKTVEPAPPEGLEFFLEVMLSQCFRRFINTKPAKRSKVKLPVHTPNSAAGPVLLDNGCTFVELKPSTVSDVSKSVSHFPSPPVLKNYAGQVVSQSCIAEMKQLRSVHPEKWTVTQLAKKYQVSRSFVISNVFSAEEREKFKGEIDEMITNMSIKQQRGWILRHMIRSDRQASW